tara:strand:- start:6527 stop:7861 length:1335 start_codon:yes stop_codon:yes gene_type:complete
MRQSLKFKKYSLLDLEKILKNKNINFVNNFYKDFIKNYKSLDKTYKFNVDLNEKYIFKQIKSIFTFRKDKKNLFLIPIGIKDNINTLELDTKFGIKIRKEFKSGNNARLVTQIEENLGLIFSKLSCAEFAVHYIEKKRGKNPFNKNHIAGTSSTGAAISVCVGALPVAIGTQTAGSILRPSSYCGVIGFKPTYGAIDRIGVLKTNDLSDTVGIISRDFYGVKKVFNTIVKIGKDYPWTINYKKNYNEYKNKNHIKIGFFDDSLQVYKNFSEETKFEYIETILKLKKKGMMLSKIKNQKIFDNFHDNFYTIYHNSLYYYLKNINPEFSGLSKMLKKIIHQGKKITNKKKIFSIQTINNVKKKFDEIFDKYDFLIIPTTAGYAPKFDQTERDDTCLIWTTLGYPSINIPIYNSKKNDLPYGLQIISKRYCDFLLLDFSKKIFNILK